MSSTLNPYVNLRGDAREAMDFYQGVFGGSVDRSTFGEMGMSQDPDEADWIMHSQLTTPAGFTLMVSDVPKHMSFEPGGNIAISLSGEDEGELRGYWDGLSTDGTISAPFERAPWGDLFGMCTDRFGVDWLVNVVAAPTI